MDVESFVLFQTKPDQLWGKMSLLKEPLSEISPIWTDVLFLEGVPSNAILVVSYIGYVSQEIPLKSSQTNVRIQLVEDTQALDEVVVVGYGTQSKKDITGSVAVVSTDAIHETPVATFAEPLQGKSIRCVYL